MHEILHEFVPAGEGGHRIAIGERLAVHNKIRLNAGNRCVSAERVTEARLHFVEDECKAISVGQFSQTLQISRQWMHNADILQDRLNDHGRDWVALQTYSTESRSLKLTG